ncbi:NYN domain-containing protein [Rhodopseudomonas faecalis]|uniref:NYN domain-containing protein n=1 Tax=Rhodopseudomonas faecalis TaxID=99655 RepID=A0A318TMH7_9BRAD|nr:NYN domain-containing protein [Rhodopseudomonas faecalis]PYE99074.1 NYN domain-containing protein [Rhodopseudomonas faecalis]
MKNAMAFFDGQNLFQHAKDAFGHFHPNYDPRKLHLAVCAARGWRATLTRFYTGVPVESEDKMWSAYWSSRIISMKRSGIHVTTRKLRYRKTDVFDDKGSPVVDHNGKQKVITTPQEKGIDVRLALDVVSLARKRQFDVALIFSQDQDLNEVVTEVTSIAEEQKRWIKVACAFPDGPSATCRRGIDHTDWFKMDETFYNACLDPRDYRPAKT